MPFNEEHHRRHSKGVHVESRFAFDPTLNTRSVLSTLRFGPTIGTEVVQESTTSQNSSSAEVEIGVKQVSNSGLNKEVDP